MDALQAILEGFRGGASESGRQIGKGYLARDEKAKAKKAEDAKLAEERKGMNLEAGLRGLEKFVHETYKGAPLSPEQYLPVAQELGVPLSELGPFFQTGMFAKGNLEKDPGYGFFQGKDDEQYYYNRGEPTKGATILKGVGEKAPKPVDPVKTETAEARRDKAVADADKATGPDSAEKRTAAAMESLAAVMAAIGSGAPSTAHLEEGFVEQYGTPEEQRIVKALRAQILEIAMEGLPGASKPDYGAMPPMTPAEVLELMAGSGPMGQLQAPAASPAESAAERDERLMNQMLGR